MADLPSEIMHDIFSRMPVKSLARFRCVSKTWCNYINDSNLETMHAKRASDDPMLIMFHQFPSDHRNSLCTLSYLEHKEQEVRKKPLVMQFTCKSSSYRYPDDIVLGCCNGLVCSSIGHRDSNTLVVIHPLRRERYELPPVNKPWRIGGEYGQWGFDLEESYRISVEETYGLGFDESTDTFKMVSVVVKEHVQTPNFCKVIEGVYTMVHVLGTDTWRRVPRVPCYPITGEGVFANGCLHWLSVEGDDDDDRPMYLGRPVISFNMTTEEFGLIEPPQGRPSGWVRVHLVDLGGEVGYVYNIVNRRVEVWVLKERGWVMHCEFKQKPPLPPGFIKVLGFWNEKGDILMTDSWKRMHVYNLCGDGLYEVNFVGWDDFEEDQRAIDVRMYQSSLFSTRYSIKNLKKC